MPDNNNNNNNNTVEQVILSDEQIKMWDKLYVNSEFNAKNKPNMYEIAGGNLLQISSGSLAGDKIFVPDISNDSLSGTTESLKLSVMLPAHGGGQETYIGYLNETENLNEIVYCPFRPITNNDENIENLLSITNELSAYKDFNISSVNVVGGSNGGSDAVRFEIEAIKRGYTGGSIILLDPSNRENKAYIDNSGNYVTQVGNGLDYRFTDSELGILADNNVPIIIFDPTDKYSNPNCKYYLESYTENVKRFSESGIDMYYVPNWPYDHNDQKFVKEALKLGFINGDNINNGEHKIETIEIMKYDSENAEYVKVTNPAEIVELFRNSGIITDEDFLGEIYQELSGVIPFYSKDGIVSNEKLYVINSINKIIRCFNSINFSDFPTFNDPSGISGLILNCVSKYNECGSTLKQAIQKAGEDAMYISDSLQRTDIEIANTIKNEIQ